MKMSWENPGNSLRILTKSKSSIFLQDLYPPKPFFPQIVIQENLNFDLEKSLKNGYEKKGNLVYGNEENQCSVERAAASLCHFDVGSFARALIRLVSHH